jgi:hypothetical protein
LEENDDLIDNDCAQMNITPISSQNKEMKDENDTPVENKLSIPKKSLRQEFKRQSMNIVKRLSVLEQHKMIIDPLSFSNKIRESISSSSNFES